jgi:hypothetical protein
MNTGEIILYQNQQGTIKIDVRLEEETVWLTQAQLCELFQKSKATISEHIKNVFAEGELDEKLVVRKFRTTTPHGAMADKTQELEVNGYNLDVIISVGYRVKSPQGTQFRIWATQRLKEYIIKGFDNGITYRRQEKILLTLKSCLLSILHSQTFLHISNKTVCPVKPSSFL